MMEQECWPSTWGPKAWLLCPSLCPSLKLSPSHGAWRPPCIHQPQAHQLRATADSQRGQRGQRGQHDPALVFFSFQIQPNRVFLPSRYNPMVHNGNHLPLVYPAISLIYLSVNLQSSINCLYNYCLAIIYYLSSVNHLSSSSYNISSIIISLLPILYLHNIYYLSFNVFIICLHIIYHLPTNYLQPMNHLSTTCQSSLNQAVIHLSIYITHLLSIYHL